MLEHHQLGRGVRKCDGSRRAWKKCQKLRRRLGCAYTIPGYDIILRVAHTAHDQKLLARVRRLRGQIEAIERGIDAGDECAKVLHLIAASRGAINALMSEVLEGHVREHVVDPAKERSAARAKGAQQLIDVLRAYLA